MFIPLRFAPGEAFQFDWREETLILGGRTTKVSIAHVRLCHSRLPICVGYADRVVIVSGGQVVGEHGRQFGRDKTIYDPWHYLPVLERKPGALRNGASFRDWDLPAPIQTVWGELKQRPGGDREFVDLLCAIKTHGCEAVEKAASKAIALGAVSFDVIFNLLSRQAEPPPASLAEQLPEHLTLRHLALADCGRYDRLLEGGSHAA